MAFYFGIVVCHSVTRKQASGGAARKVPFSLQSTLGCKVVCGAEYIIVCRYSYMGEGRKKSMRLAAERPSPHFCNKNFKIISRNNRVEGMVGRVA